MNQAAVQNEVALDQIARGAGKVGDNGAVLSEQGVEERVDDIDNLMNDEIFSSNEPERIAGRCPVFYDALKRREVETVMVVRIAMDNARTNGYLICAEPRSRRIWQEEECAVVFFLAKLIANRIRIDGETLK